MHVAAKRAAALAEDGGGGGGSPMPVAEWLPSYGTDPYYPSRRIRRITERVYFKVILLSYFVAVASIIAFPLVVVLWWNGDAGDCVTISRARMFSSALVSLVICWVV